MPQQGRKRRGEHASSSDDGGYSKKPRPNKFQSTKPSSKLGGVVGGGGKTPDGEEYWELGGKRRLVVSEFKGTKLVNIREFYEKDGATLPGKKGISLPLSQFSTLITLLPHIETIWKQKGETLPRPDYSNAPLQAEESTPAEEGDEMDAEGGVAVADDKHGKKNFEATSDEEE